MNSNALDALDSLNFFLACAFFLLALFFSCALLARDILAARAIQPDPFCIKTILYYNIILQNSHILPINN